MENELLNKIVKILDEKKAIDLKTIDIKEKSSLADYMVVASGTSTTHIKALADNVEEELKKELDVLKTEHQGSLLLITARGTRREIMEKIQAKNPLFCEVLPLTLEEIFISETEVAGYEVKNLFQ